MTMGGMKNTLVTQAVCLHLSDDNLGPFGMRSHDFHQFCGFSEFRCLWSDFRILYIHHLMDWILLEAVHLHNDFDGQQRKSFLNCQIGKLEVV